MPALSCENASVDVLDVYGGTNELTVAEDIERVGCSLGSAYQNIYNGQGCYVFSIQLSWLVSALRPDTDRLLVHAPNPLPRASASFYQKLECFTKYFVRLRLIICGWIAGFCCDCWWLRRGQSCT